MVGLDICPINQIVLAHLGGLVRGERRSSVTEARGNALQDAHKCLWRTRSENCQDTNKLHLLFLDVIFPIFADSRMLNQFSINIKFAKILFSSLRLSFWVLTLTPSLPDPEDRKCQSPTTFSHLPADSRRGWGWTEPRVAHIITCRTCNPRTKNELQYRSGEGIKIWLGAQTPGFSSPVMYMPFCGRS